MSKYLGDFAANATVRFSFNTYAPDQTPITLAGVSTQSHFAISKNGVDIAELDASTITITVDAGGVTGFHRVSVVMGNDDDFATGADYEIRLTAGTVATISVVGTVLARWSCENRTAVDVSIRDAAITTNTFDTGVLATDTDIADAVLDELVAEHATSGSVGAVLTAIDGNVDATVTNTASIATIVTTGVAIADGTLTAAKFATDAITADKIAANAIDGDALSAGALTDIATAVHAGTIITGTVTIAATSTLIPFSAISPTLTVVDQLVGRVLIFKTDTTTAQLRGQAATITASTTDSISVSSSEAFTTAPANGDTFVVV